MVGFLETKAKGGSTVKQVVLVAVQIPARVLTLRVDQQNLCVLLREYALRNQEREYLGNEIQIQM